MTAKETGSPDRREECPNAGYIPFQNGRKSPGSCGNDGILRESFLLDMGLIAMSIASTP